jgi:hypothetical protein
LKRVGDSESRVETAFQHLLESEHVMAELERTLAAPTTQAVQH